MLDQARKAVTRAQIATREDLDADETLAAAFAWRLAVIGEAASYLSAETRTAHAEIPWPQIIAMRHRLIHGYDSIDLDIVWQTLASDLPSLIVSLENALRSP
jgi:uncharacterized protein with HEPN domain